MTRFISVVAFCALSTSVSFADETKRSMPVYDWSGFYVGAHAGYGTPDVGGHFDSLGSAPIATFNEHFDMNSMLGGVHAGYNWQHGNMLYGVEGDYTFAGFEDSFVDGENNRQELELDGIATVRGRLGAIAGRYMAYLTAGAAFSGGKLTVEDGDDSLSFNAAGLVYGAGFEYAVRPGIRLRAEYMRMDFNKRFVSSELDDLNDGDDDDMFRFGGVDTIRVGLNVSLAALSDNAYDTDMTYGENVSISDFSGFYAGLHGAGATTDVGGLFDEEDTRFSNFDMFGAGGGVQVGYNVQHGALLFGVEADYSRMAIGDAFVDDDDDEQALSVDYFGTVRGRLGVVANSLVVYGTVGYAYGALDLDVENNTDGLTLDGHGLAYGGGVEKKITDTITLKAEYMRLDFNANIASTNSRCNSCTSEIDALSDGNDSDFLNFDGHDVVKVGVNYLF